MGNPLVCLSNIPLEILRIASISPNNLIPKGKLLYESQDFNGLYQYYQKSPKILALQYINNTKSLTNDEKLRLSHELTKKDIKVLENSLPADDPILRKIIERYSLELSSGYKIFL